MLFLIRWKTTFYHILTMFTASPECSLKGDEVVGDPDTHPLSQEHYYLQHQLLLRNKKNRCIR